MRGRILRQENSLPIAYFTAFGSLHPLSLGDVNVQDAHLGDHVGESPVSTGCVPSRGSAVRLPDGQHKSTSYSCHRIDNCSSFFSHVL